MLASLWSSVRDHVAGMLSVATAFCASRALTYTIQKLRPELGDGQLQLLRSHFETAILAFFQGEVNIGRQIRGLLAIVFHELTDEEQELLWQQLVQIMNAFDLHGVMEEEAPVVAYDDDDFTALPDSTLDELVSTFGVKSELASQIPRCVRGALVAELANSPPCSITLEDIVDDRGKITADVVALVQRIEPSGNDNKQFHVFLYKRPALEQWFAIGGNVNPLTRERVHRSSQLFSLS
ncbi:unnamed protein product (mitochondrion) [Plasmodiophora brassicae]|uniref:Uncharacterized protein n=1 Tax=Plasmodiophora brassicae TaxID=37360 RepID=A0A0G4IXU4_PLABS|nr:hypothetical protein PBRA_007698 [Plasmodiophora brassicae]SPQ99595.1 unnamed protein product [Plasmodiophora brassicae]